MRSFSFVLRDGVPKITCILQQVLALLFLLVFMLISGTCFGVRTRSIHRALDPLLPAIKVRWEGDSKSYIYRSYYYLQSALFEQYDPEHISQCYLPKGPIPFRYEPGKTVMGSIIDYLINQLIREIKTKGKHQEKNKKFHKKGKLIFKDFIVLKDRNFDLKQASGLLIVKFKKYPFIVKLLFKTPKTFARPLDNKGMEQRFFFAMGGGMDRYLTGFKRVKNLHTIKKMIEQDELWSPFIDTPRKWFWIPKRQRWIELTGYNIGGKAQQTTKLPSIYALVADLVEDERSFSLKNPEDRSMGVGLSRDLQERLDPNIYNFMVDKHTGKIVIIDTEHFPTILGLTEELEFNGYVSWYYHLGLKYLKDAYFRTKAEQRAITKGKGKPVMYC